MIIGLMDGKYYSIFLSVKMNHLVVIAMAGDWLKFEISTSDKPEIWLIAGSLSIDPDAVVGKMLRVWAWFDQHSLNGNAPSVTKSLLDRLVGVTGFCNSIISAGWMSENDGEISLTNFERHNGKTAKDRALTAKRVAKHKLVSGNEKVTLVPLPKEEKRREENIVLKDIVPAGKPDRKPQKSKGARLPDDWVLPKASGDWALTEGLTRDQVLREAEQFKDYWHSRAGAAAVKVDWTAAWRTWVRKSIEYSRGKPTATGHAAGFTDTHTDRSWADAI